MKTIWDGESFRQVSDEEAARLIKEDKAQGEAEHGFSHFKYRHQFTGYVTREMRAEAPVKVETPKPEKEEAPKPEKSWRQMRKEVGKAIGKPAMKVTKADVEEFLNGSDD